MGLMESNRQLWIGQNLPTKLHKSIGFALS